MRYSVGAVARMANITVRTLHHYDQVGLLSPAGRSATGHREYDEQDISRLQNILFYRELGFGLDEVAVLLDDEADPVVHLRRQRTLLAERVQRLGDMLASVEEILAAQAVNTHVSAEERLALFGRWRPSPGYADEAEERWGWTRHWKQGRDRMAGYTAEDLTRMQEEFDDWVGRLRVLVKTGVAPTSDEALDLMEEHRRALCRWWFDCDHAMHREFGRLCATDAEQLAFLVRPELQLPGTGAYLRDAIEANAARHA